MRNVTGEAASSAPETANVRVCQIPDVGHLGGEVRAGGEACRDRRNLRAGGAPGRKVRAVVLPVNRNEDVRRPCRRVVERPAEGHTVRVVRRIECGETRRDDGALGEDA